MAEWETERLEKLVRLWDKGLITAAERAAKSPAREGGEVKYSWGDAEGVANKKLSPITGELQRSLLSEKNNIIVDSYEKVAKMVKKAFDDRTAKETGYFGIISPDELKKIQNKATNVAKDLQGKLFKENKGYVLAATSDSIRHLNEELKLSREEIEELLDRLADIVLDNDTVKFSHYLRAEQKIPGLLFEKAFPDGSYGAFNLISGRRRRLGLQTMYIEGRDAKIEKSSLSSLPVNNPRPTSMTNGSRTLSDNSIRSSSEKSKPKSQERDELPSDRELLMAKKADGRNAEALTAYQKKVKRLEALQRKLERQQDALEEAKKIAKKSDGFRFFKGSEFFDFGVYFFDSLWYNTNKRIPETLYYDRN